MPDGREWTFRIPVPPSTNKLYRNVVGRGRVKTARYLAWQKEAGTEIMVQMRPRPHIAGNFCLTIRLPSGIDIDNIKAVPDLLKHMGMIVDDKHMVELHVYRSKFPNCSVTLWGGEDAVSIDRGAERRAVAAGR